MRTLWLHVGCHKTGSSFLQASLAASVERLAAAGVRYPVDPDAGSAALIPVGNGLGVWRRLADGPDWPEGERSDLLFSSEILHTRLRDPWALASLRRRARAAGVERVVAVVYLRGPVDHAASWYQQQVKRHGTTRFVAEFFEDYAYPATTVALLDALAEVGELRVRNYDVERRRLAASLEEVLELPEGTLVTPAAAVNRSLTRAELGLQRRVNERLGPSGELVADVLCEEFPAVPAETELPPEPVQRRMLARQAAALDRLDALLPEGQPLDRGTRSPPVGAGTPLTAAQLEAVVGRLVEEVRERRRGSPGHLVATRWTGTVRGARRLRGRALRWVARRRAP
jgi:hypothetical protein